MKIAFSFVGPNNKQFYNSKQTDNFALLFSDPPPHPWGAEEKRKSEGKVRTIKSYNENVTRINDTQGVNPMFVIATMQSVS